MADAVFVRQGERFIPTELAVGPWDPRALHGGAPGALLARAVEGIQSEDAMMVTRMTVELLRPVPKAPLTVSATVLRPGRKVQLVQASVVAEGTEVARATALRIRNIGLKLDAAPKIERMEPGPAAIPPSDPPMGMGFGAAMDLRFAHGDFFTPGPATAWFRLLHPIVDGEVPTPLMRVMAAADFGNGVSHELDFTRYLFINPDLTVYLHRQPVGEWICLDARTEITDSGVGIAESRLFDEQGQIGRAVQSLLLDRR